MIGTPIICGEDKCRALVNSLASKREGNCCILAVPDCFVLKKDISNTTMISLKSISSVTSNSNVHVDNSS